LLWGGNLVSTLGSWLLVLAIPAHVLQVTGSLRDTGLTLFSAYLPRLALGPFAGVFSDRWDRRRLMIGASVFQTAAVSSMLLGLSPGRYWVLYLALAAENAGGVLYTPAAQARTPSMVGPLLTSANALNSVASGSMELIGGPLGGVLLLLLGVRWLIVADAASYLVAAVANWLTSADGSRGSGTSVTRDLVAGARALLGQPVARALFPVTVLFLAGNASLSAVLIAFGVRRLGGSLHTGYLLFALGAGVLLSGPVLRPLIRVRRLLAACLLGDAVAYLVLFTSSSLPVALPTALVIGLLGTLCQAVPLTMVQRVVPDEVLGRVCAAFVTGEAMATLVGAVGGPFVAQAIGLSGIAMVASAVTVSAAVLAFIARARCDAGLPRVPPAGGRPRRLGGWAAVLTGW
jgi:MFS family permease